MVFDLKGFGCVCLSKGKVTGLYQETKERVGAVVVKEEDIQQKSHKIRTHGADEDDRSWKIFESRVIHLGPRGLGKEDWGVVLCAHVHQNALRTPMYTKVHQHPHYCMQ